MKTLKQLTSIGIAIAIMLVFLIGLSWLLEHHYINKTWNDILSIGIGPLLFIYFAIKAWKANQQDKKNGL